MCVRVARGGGGRPTFWRARPHCHCSIVRLLFVYTANTACYWPVVSACRASAKGTPLKYDWAVASVNGVPVIKPNVFVGKSVAHGIDKVLVPGAAKVSMDMNMDIGASTGDNVP